MSRKLFIAGNWKMNGLLSDSKERIKELLELLKENKKNVDILVCPPFTLLSTILEITENTNINVGSQDCHFNKNGAHTGDISPLMLNDLGCKYTLVGHSERRVDHKESNEIVKNKAEVAIDAGLVAIICIGETLEEKEAGKTLEVLTQQIKESLPKNTNSQNVIIAYEPVWAIGTGLVPSIEDIQNTHKEIRNYLKNIIKEDALNTRILYGGSLKPSNAEEILSLEDVDGGLIGGASLVAKDFFEIIEKSK